MWDLILFRWEVPFGRFNWEEETGEGPTYKAQSTGFQVPSKMFKNLKKSSAEWVLILLILLLYLVIKYIIRRFQLNKHRIKVLFTSYTIYICNLHLNIRRQDAVGATCMAAFDCSLNMRCGLWCSVFQNHYVNYGYFHVFSFLFLIFYSYFFPIESDSCVLYSTHPQTKKLKSPRLNCILYCVFAWIIINYLLLFSPYKMRCDNDIYHILFLMSATVKDVTWGMMMTVVIITI